MNLTRCLERLDEAIAAAGAIGIATDDAARVRETARTRLRFPSDAYVLALAGGTGVGKSTLLNALAGEEVSPASARRPTTAEPVAWVPADKRADLAELLEWLGVTAVREHRAEGLRELAVLDLPDFDSVTIEHRARVDALLPKVDAVAWVMDPEKYKDEVVHGLYLRRWAPRVARQVVVLNRADLLSPQDLARVRDDMRAQLARDGADDASVAVARAREGTDGVAEVRRWLDSGLEAKRVISARLSAEARVATRDLARRAGIADGAAAPLVDPARRERATNDVTRAVLALVDIHGLERQAVAATRLAARPRGAGPFGHVTSAVYRLTGRARAAADPAGYLGRWRVRGSLAPAIEPVRDLLATALPSVPLALRPAVSALSAPDDAERRVAGAVDRALAAEAAEFRVPASVVWSFIGFGQYLVTGLLVFGALWLAALFVLHEAPFGSVDLPYLGPVPTPVVFLAGVLLAGYLLALALRTHAGWLGGRWAQGIAVLVASEIHARVRDTILSPLDALDAGRERLAAAVRGIDEDCGQG